MGPVYYCSKLMTHGICQVQISAWRCQQKKEPGIIFPVEFARENPQRHPGNTWFERKELRHTSQKLAKADRQKARVETVVAEETIRHAGKSMAIPCRNKGFGSV